MYQEAGVRGALSGVSDAMYRVGLTADGLYGNGCSERKVGMMICPCCGGRNYHVVDSRERDQYIHRRRKCCDCDSSFVTHEYVVRLITPKKVSKDDAGRENHDNH